MYKILIADDEMTIRKGLITIVDWDKLKCFIPCEAADGVDALEKIKGALPDIVITDICMPGMDGLELAQHISEHYSHVKVIILTGYADFEYAQKAIKFGVIDFVLKPTEIISLESAVHKAISTIEAEEGQKRLVQNLSSALLYQIAAAPINSRQIPEAQFNIIINKVNEYIAINYKKNIRLASIADHVHVNSSYLSRLYSQETGYTLTEAISKYRIEKAKELLLDPEVKAYEAGDRVGIEDPAYFSLMFKRYAGCSPTEYRQFHTLAHENES